MKLKTALARILYKGISSEKVSFHDAVRLYGVLNYYISRRLSPSGAFSSRNVVAYMGKATHPKILTAWTSVAFPAEILIPFNIYPLTLEVIAGTFSSLGLARHFLDAADARDIPNTMCSFHRMLLGISQKGTLGKPAVVGAASIFCDGNVKSFAEAARQQEVPFLFIDIPYEDGKEAIAYVKEQLRAMLKELVQLTKIVDYERGLKETAQRINETFALFHRFYDLRKESTKNLYCGHEVANFCFPNHFLLGRPELIKLMRRRIEDVASGRRQNRNYKSLNADKKAKRLMWLHIVPQYDTPLWRIIDNGETAKVVCDEYSSVRYQDYDIDDPLSSISKRLINHPTNGPLSRRVEHIVKVARDFKVEGIVHYSSWGCHQAAGNVYLLGRELEAAGFKFLNINGDAVDAGNSSVEQHRTRLEAFLENW